MSQELKRLAGAAFLQRRHEVGEPDKMLQARIFPYADAHRHRLGTHYEALPANAPKCPVHHYHKGRGNAVLRSAHRNADAYYEPNSFAGPAERPELAEPPLKISGDADRYNHRIGNDDFSWRAH